MEHASKIMLPDNNQPILNIMKCHICLCIVSVTRINTLSYHFSTRLGATHGRFGEWSRDPATAASITARPISRRRSQTEAGLLRLPAQSCQHSGWVCQCSSACFTFTLTGVLSKVASAGLVIYSGLHPINFNPSTEGLSRPGTKPPACDGTTLPEATNIALNCSRWSSNMVARATSMPHMPWAVGSEWVGWMRCYVSPQH